MHINLQITPKYTTQQWGRLYTRKCSVGKSYKLESSDEMLMEKRSFCSDPHPLNREKPVPHAITVFCDVISLGQSRNFGVKVKGAPTELSRLHPIYKLIWNVAGMPLDSIEVLNCRKRLETDVKSGGWFIVLWGLNNKRNMLNRWGNGKRSFGFRH